jgi:DNA-binding MarR family transcriptional regulator
MIELNASSDLRAKMMGEIGSTVMRWQDETQAYDEAVGERLALNAAERRCLGFLHGGPQPAGAIAAAIGLTPAAVTALVDRLEARGLLTRKRSEEDRRKVIIEGTAKTARISEDYYGSIARDGIGVLEAFGNDELATILRFMQAALELQRRHLQALEAQPIAAEA